MQQEQSQQPKAQNLTNDLKSKKPSSKYPWLLVPIIIVALAAGYWFSQNKQNNDPEINLSPSEVGQLPEDAQKVVLAKQLADLLAEEKALTAESDRGDRFSVYIQLGEVYTGLDRHEEALAALDKIKDERSGNTRLWMTYALVYKNMGNLAEARANVRKALDLDPELADNWLFMLGVFSDLPREAQEAIFKEALERSGNLPEIQAAYQAWQTSAQ